VPGRVILAMNNKMPRPVVSKEDVERTLKQEIQCEFKFDGSKPDEAAVKGELLVISDPKSFIAIGANALSEIIAGTSTAGQKSRKLGFSLKVG
jgi:hypothetical protein